MTGIELITEERREQIEKHGWDLKNDKDYTKNQLLFAAESYAMRPFIPKDQIEYLWPFDKKWYKPTPNNRIKELAKAGALIAAEIDRIQYLEKL